MKKRGKIILLTGWFLSYIYCIEKVFWNIKSEMNGKKIYEKLCDF